MEQETTVCKPISERKTAEYAFVWGGLSSNPKSAVRKSKIEMTRLTILPIANLKSVMQEHYAPVEVVIDIQPAQPIASTSSGF